MSSTSLSPLPLPVSWQECKKRGWSSLDILLVTGDAYVDHPSFGVALIGRLLESHGWRVAVLSQPRIDNPDDFKSYPLPKLFVGITAGNLDSVVANYSGNGRVRDKDAYSPDGNPWRGQTKEKKQRRRPDRATIIYTSLARAAFAGVPVVLGGLEASLRRFVHYDYQQKKLRDSILCDSKADLLVYGMGERAIVEIGKRLEQGRSLTEIHGTCRRLTTRELLQEFTLDKESSLKNDKNTLVLSSAAAIRGQKDLFLHGEIALDRHGRSASPRLVLQQQKSHWVLQYPSAKPLNQEELDHLYALPFTRKPHPPAEIPAHKMIENSVTIVRGCSGNCAFCAITRHQGAQITSRSRQSIVAECKTLAGGKGFRGTITDLGGPTANLYATSCRRGGCKKRDCLFPKICPHLVVDEEAFLKLLQEVGAIEEVKHLFISSGLRMELMLKTAKLHQKILLHHSPGALKIAPEHTSDELLAIMHKPGHQILKDFVDKSRMIARNHGRKCKLIPYCITSHPGSTPDDARKMRQDLKKLGLDPRQSQDFTPTPGTLSTAMFVAEKRADNGKPLTVTKQQAKRNIERKTLRKKSESAPVLPRKKPQRKR